PRPGRSRARQRDDVAGLRPTPYAGGRPGRSDQGQLLHLRSRVALRLPPRAAGGGPAEAVPVRRSGPGGRA
ncbi:MAG: hypothetical protein ACR2JO_05155, partial [Mycobacteriales bacterium]